MGWYKCYSTQLIAMFSILKKGLKGKIKPILLILSQNNHSSTGSTEDTDVYQHMMWDVWMPHIRAVVINWDPHHCDLLLTLIETWMPLLPQWMLLNILNQLVLYLFILENFVFFLVCLELLGNLVGCKKWVKKFDLGINISHLKQSSPISDIPFWRYKCIFITIPSGPCSLIQFKFSSIMFNLLLQVLPQLQREVDRWNPLTDPVPLHSWIHPWLPHMHETLQPL